MKDQALSILWSNVRASHKKFKLLCSQNVLLSQHLAESTSFTLEAVSKSFENVLDQVEYFHHPLTLFREQIRPNQVVIDGNVVFLRKQTCWVSWPPIFYGTYLIVHCNGKVYKILIYWMNAFFTCLRCFCMILSTWLWIFASLRGLSSKLIGCRCDNEKGDTNLITFWYLFWGTWSDHECTITDLCELTRSFPEVYWML